MRLRCLGLFKVLLGIIGLVAGGLAVAAHAAPAGPPAGNPIINSHVYQRNSEMNIDTATMRFVGVSTFTNIPSLPLGIRIGGATYNSTGISSIDPFIQSSGTITTLNTSILTAGNLFLNVKSAPFSATGNGTTDDSAAIQSAITYLSSLPNGGVLFFPKGVYKAAISLPAGADKIIILGEGDGTKFIPASPTTFVFTCLQSFSEFEHHFRDFQIISTSNYVGRGIYINNGGFNNFSGIHLSSLEYGIYSNSTEWNHIEGVNFDHCKYQLTFTNLNFDLLGNAQTVNQNAAYHYITKCHFWQSAGEHVGFGLYFDEEDDPLGDKASAIYVTDSDFVGNAVNIASGDGGNGDGGTANKFNPLHLTNVFVNNSTNTDSQSFNIYSIGNGDMYLKNTNVELDNVQFEDSVNFSQRCRVTGTNVQFLGNGSSSISVSSDTIAMLDNVVADNNGGYVLDGIQGRHFHMTTPGRPITMRLPSARTGFVLSNSTAHLVNVNSDSQSGAFGGLPPTYLGSPTVTRYTGDGFYGNRCIKVSGVTGDAVKYRADLVSGKYYVTTYSIRGDGQISVATGNSIHTYTGNGNLALSADWRTYGAMTKSSFTGTAIQFFELNTSTVFYISSLQTVPFDDFDSALNFLDSNTFVINPTEVVGLPVATILASTAPYIGELLTCSDCTTTRVCVSTGTTLAGQYTVGSSTSSKCQ